MVGDHLTTIPPPPGFNLPVVMSVPQLYSIDQQRENVTVMTEHLGYHISKEVDVNPASLLLNPEIYFIQSETSI